MGTRTETGRAAATRTRILVSALVLFNRNGEPNTSTNEIADETDISPGNLHYHFRKKADIVSALLAEFQADAARVLVEDTGDEFHIDDFWVFLHLLLELTAAYRFLFRDTETLTAEYPDVKRALSGFARALTAAFEMRIHALLATGTLEIDGNDVSEICRNLVVQAFYRERYDSLVAGELSADVAALRTARAVLGVLRPYVAPDQRPDLDAFDAGYRA